MVAGAGLGILATSDVVDAQKTRLDVIPTPQATTLMGLFGLRYPIFQAPYGGGRSPAAVSNAGAMGAIALWNNTPDAARQSVEKLRSQTQRPFVVNYVLAFEPESLPAALEAGASVVQFSWGLPTRDVVTRLLKAGAKFGVQVGTAEGARAALDAGANYLGVKEAKRVDTCNRVPRFTSCFRRCWTRRNKLRYWWQVALATGEDFGQP